MTRFIGLTGGIATGKSTVSKMLVELGAKLVDADVVAREVVEPGQPALAQISTRFPGVIAADGTLDREQLGERIFGNQTERLALNAIVHPQVQARVLELSQGYAEEGAAVVIYDAALLIENKLHEAMEGTVLVVAPLPVQKQRLMNRNALTAEAADARIASQMSLHEKRKVATWVIDNGGTLEQTRAQVEAAWPAISGKVAPSS